MINKFLLLLVVILPIFFSCVNKQKPFVSMTINKGEYIVKSLGDRVLTLDGKGTNELWENANLLSDFQYPWQPESPPKTHFRALHNNEYLYFIFQVDDPDIHLGPNTGNDRMDALGSDRVELFFKKDDSMNPYYALEIDPSNRVFDSKGALYRSFEDDWRFPRAHLDIASHIGTDAYTVEGRISISILKDFGLLKNGKIQTGVFRANFVGTDFKWISWIKPDAEKPDFHIPSAFGLFILEQ